MAKSKIVNANKKVADTVTTGFKNICDVVVNSYTVVEDKFVEKFLTKEGESIEDTKKRLKTQYSNK